MKRIMATILSLTLASTLAIAQTLEDYFKVAAENNPGLKAKYKEFEAALETATQVSTLPDPTISFGVFISPVETRVGPQRAKVSLTQMFPWFGTLKTRGDAATLRAEAKYQAFLDARNRLFYQVAAAYYPLYELHEWIQLEEENIRILESYKTIANQKFKNGKGNMVDVLRVDIMLKESMTNVEILRQKEKPLLTSFNQLLNRSESEPVNVTASLSIELPNEGLSKDSLLSINPRLDEIDLKKKSAISAEKAAVKQGSPMLGLGIEYVNVGRRSDMDLPDNGKDVLMPMATVSIPIFRGKYKAAVREAQIKQEQYDLEKESYANTLSSAFETTWFEINQQWQFIQLYKEQIEETRQALSLLFTAYGNSGKEFEEILRMQQQLLKYQKMKVQSETDFQIAMAKLNYLTSKSY